MKLSIVATLYHSEVYLQEFYSRMRKAVANTHNTYEFVFVNDGSPDNSREQVLALAAGDPHITLIDLSRNFGHHKAIMTGLLAATGDAVFLIDSDLEEAPEWLELFWEAYCTDPELDMIYGKQLKRKGNREEQVSGWLLYKLLNLVTGYAYPRDTTTARLMSRRFIEGLRRFPEKEFDIWTLFLLNGFRQKSIAVQKSSKGSTTYTLRRKLRMALDMLTSFSTRPLYLVTITGLLVFGSSLIYICWLIYRYITGHRQIDTAVLLGGVWFMGGLILVAIGTVSLYLGKMYLEVKNRPTSIIRRIYPEQTDNP